MNFLKKLSASNTSKSLYKGMNKVLDINPKKLTLATLSSLVFFSSTASAYTYADIPLADNNSKIYEKILLQFDMGSSNQYNKIIKQFDENVKNIVIILDNDLNQFVPLDKFNMPNSAHRYSHMDMVEHSVENNLNFLLDKDVAIIKSNVFSGDTTTLKTAFSNIKMALEENPNKNFIINMSLEGGVGFMGNVNFHQDIINLAKNYSNIKIIKSAGNSTASTGMLSSIIKSIKPSLESEFKKYLQNNTYYSISELKKYFIDSNDGYISYIQSHSKEILNLEKFDKNNFQETEILKQALIKEYNSNTLTQQQRNNLKNNLKIVSAYSPIDFVKDFQKNTIMQKDIQAQKLIFLLKKMDCIDKFNQLSLDKYQSNFNTKTSSLYNIFNKEFTNFILLKYDKYNKVFQNGYVNTTSYTFYDNNQNFVCGPTDLLRSFSANGEKFHYLSTGSSTAAPVLSSTILKELRTSQRNNLFEKNNKIKFLRK